MPLGVGMNPWSHHSGAVVPGFFLVKDNVRSHVQRLWRQVLKVEEFVTTDWTPSSPDLNPTENFCEIMFPSYAPQIAQEVSDAQVQI